MAMKQFILLAAFLLGACSIQRIKNGGMDDFSLNIPSEFRYKYVRNDKSVAFSNFEAPKFKKNDTDTYIEVYPPITNKKCNALTIGITDFQERNMESNLFGRTSAWDGRGEEGWEFPQNWESIVCKKEGSPMPKEVYGFCAEKNGKTVVICLNLMKDNPQLAEEIFKSFRWVK